MLPIKDVVLTKKVWEVGNAPKNLAVLKQLQTHFKIKHNKGVGRPFPRVPPHCTIGLPLVTGLVSTIINLS